MDPDCAATCVDRNGQRANKEWGEIALDLRSGDIPNKAGHGWCPQGTTCNGGKMLSATLGLGGINCS
eukprot:1582881-Karenia_brevis.AAC.1